MVESRLCRGLGVGHPCFIVAEMSANHGGRLEHAVEVVRAAAECGADAIKLDVAGTNKDDVLKELIALLKLDDKSQGMLFKMLKRRENLGSTGIGRGIAIVGRIR